MSCDAARPRYTLPLAGKEYELLGTFALIEAVEYALKEGIIQVAMRVMEMGMGETAKLVAAMLTASGHKLTAAEVGDILVGQVGLTGDEFVRLRLHLNAFLNIMLTPPKDRERKAAEVGELIGRWETARPASPGATTGASA